MSARRHTLTFPTQDYVSRQHGDTRIDAYVAEPTRGVTARTGCLLLIHGWGNDGRAAYEAESLDFADRFDLVVTRVEYRDSGREAHNPSPPATFDVPYDFSKLQTIDCLRAAKTTLDRYPLLDRRRLLLWGGSQGAHIAAQCLIFAPSLWAGAVLCCGLYHPYTFAEATADFYHWDIAVYPGLGFVEYAFGKGATLPEREAQIRSPRRNAPLMPDGVPVVLIHGTHDDNVDIRHSVSMYARLLSCGKLARFYAISNGDHGLAGAEADDENSRHKATLKYAADVLGLRQRSSPGVWPAHPTTIMVDGGRFEVQFGDDGPSLVWVGV